MSDVNHHDHSPDNNDDNNMVTPTNEIEMNSEATTTDQTDSPGRVSISPLEPTLVSQTVENEIDRTIDELTAYEVHFPPASTSVNEPDISVGASSPLSKNWPYYDFEQSNGRITHPSDTLQSILVRLLYPMAMRFVLDLIWNNIPLSVQDTQPHTMGGRPSIQVRRDTIIHHENDGINEDGTVLNDTDDIMDDENTNHEVQNQMIVSESTGAEVIDDLTTSNVNLTISTDAQDDGYTNIQNTNERIMEFDAPPVTEHQVNSENGHNEIGQALPRSENVDTSNIPTTPVLIPPIATTSTIESSEQAEEIQPLQAGPTDNNNRMTGDPDPLLATDPDVLQLNTNNRKESSPLESTQERIIS